MTSPEITIRKAVASEAERLADIALLAWERDLQPFLSGEAASRANEKRRLGIAVHELLDRTIVAEINGSPVGWCARARRATGGSSTSTPEARAWSRPRSAAAPAPRSRRCTAPAAARS